MKAERKPEHHPESLYILVRRVAKLCETGHRQVRGRGRLGKGPRARRVQEARELFCVAALLADEVEVRDLAAFLHTEQRDVRRLVTAGLRRHAENTLFRWRVTALTHQLAALGFSVIGYLPFAPTTTNQLTTP